MTVNDRAFLVEYTASAHTFKGMRTVQFNVVVVTATIQQVPQLIMSKYPDANIDSIKAMGNAILDGDLFERKFILY